jgi:hypothetical protein
VTTPLRPPAPDRPFGTPSPHPLNHVTRTGRTGLVPGITSVLVYVLAVIPLLSVVSLPLGYVCGILAIVLAVRALRRPGSKTRPVFGLVFGIIGLGFSLLVTAFAVWMWPQISAYSTCEGRANTNTEHEACSAQFASDFATKVETSFGLPHGTIKVNPRQP